MHNPPQPSGMLIRGVPGAEDYQFKWAIGHKSVSYQRLPDGQFVPLAHGIDNREAALAVAQVFALGLTEACKMRMSPWPPQQPGEQDGASDRRRQPARQDHSP